MSQIPEFITSQCSYQYLSHFMVPSQTSQCSFQMFPSQTNACFYQNAHLISSLPVRVLTSEHWPFKGLVPNVSVHANEYPYQYICNFMVPSQISYCSYQNAQRFKVSSQALEFIAISCFYQNITHLKFPYQTTVHHQLVFLLERQPF